MRKTIPVLLLLTLAACAPAAQATATQAPAPTEAAPTEAAPTEVPPTEAPTEEPTEAAEQPAFFDDFEDPSGGWFVGVDEFGEARYQDGGYLVAPPANPGGWSTTDSPNDESFSDMSVEVDATKLAGPDVNEYGVYCRLSGDPITFYLGLIGNDGIYAIYERLADDWSLIDGGAAGSLTLNDGSNQLRLDCIGSTISLYVNGELVAEGTDDTLTLGEGGVYTGTLNEVGVEILFDNFSVYLP
ncbi:MAG: hypothetical protein WD740_01365 [Anaerolineales bacterium]